MTLPMRPGCAKPGRAFSKLRKGNIREYYDIGSTIATGAFSIVKGATCKATGQPVAVKILKLPKDPSENAERLREQIFTEIDIMSRLEHRSIVHLDEYFVDERRIYLVMELLEGGEMLDAVLNCGKYSEEDAKQLFVQLMEALAFMHENGIVHRDLKLENLLMKEVGNLDSLKVADFGLARFLKAKPTARMASIMDTVCGSPIYVAPEVIKLLGDQEAPKYGPAVDLWSAGIILYILLCGVQPFDSENEQVLFDMIASGDYSANLDDPSWSDISDEAKDMIARLLCVDAGQRMPAKDALQHPWITSANAQDMPQLSCVQRRLKHLAQTTFSPRITLQPKRYLIRQDDMGEEVFIINSGYLEILYRGEGEEAPGHRVAHRGAGDFIGEISAIGDAVRRSASVRALTVVEVQMLSGATLRALSTEDAEFGGELQNTICTRKAESLAPERDESDDDDDEEFENDLNVFDGIGPEDVEATFEVGDSADCCVPQEAHV